MYQTNKSENANVEDNEVQERTTLINVLLIIAGGTGLALGSKYMVSSAVSIAQAWNVSERIIALTIISVGTSAPELVTNLVAAFRKETDIAVGNIIGSNIFNILMIIGFAGVAFPIPVSEQILSFDFIICIAASLIIFPFMISGGKISRIEGAVLTAGYIAYMIFLIYYR
jgi:cation:H+ antiporter